MEELQQVAVASPVTESAPEGPMLREQVVEEVLARLRRGEPVVALARAYGVDPKTIRAWRTRGEYRPRARRAYASALDPFAAWLRARAPEVEYNAAVLYRELRDLGFSGSPVIVRRVVQPLRVAARRPEATVRFETAPGQQAQVDFGQRRVWIGEECVVAHLFVFTLGFSRRLYTTAFRHERLDALLQGHEEAFHHFGGVPEQIVLDNARPVVLQHRCDRATGRHDVVWHPKYADFAAYYGFRPWAHWPYRPQTKGKTESGVKYVQHNALVGKRFGSWDHLNGWLLEWSVTVADTRVHGTTHEPPHARFARAEQHELRPLGSRPLYHHERVRHRVVPPDALVAIGGSRYSVPVQYVGETVVIRELLGSYEILHQGQVIARHAARGRHQVVMDRRHYAGLLRPRGAHGAQAPAPAMPPRYDPAYHRYQRLLTLPDSGSVAVRDLAIYAAVADGAATEDSAS